MDMPGRYLAGEGRLTYVRVLHQARGMLRHHFRRVAAVALILFVPPPLLAVALFGMRDSLAADPGLAWGLGYVAGLLVITFARLLGPVVYAGYLDEAVGKEYFEGHHVPFRVVLRTLPWARLVVADVVLVAGTTIGLALFVLPGVVWLTLFCLVGPVIVQERHGVRDGFERTLALSRRAWPMILLLVVALLAGEHAFHEWVHEATHHHDLWLQVGISWLIFSVVGGFVGLVEVALATELMARTPLPEPSVDPAAGPLPAGPITRIGAPR
jgi:hypothetical protein